MQTATVGVASKRPKEAVVMWAGIIFLVLAAALALSAAYLNGSIRRPHLRGDDSPGQRPITGWGTDHNLPGL